jgi:regulator of PEP synthase PpsR (kinase-PPPase family)
MDGTKTNIKDYSLLRSIIRGIIIILIVASIFGYATYHDKRAIQDELNKCKELYEQTQIKIINLEDKPKINITNDFYNFISDN